MASPRFRLRAAALLPGVVSLYLLTGQTPSPQTPGLDTPPPQMADAPPPAVLERMRKLLAAFGAHGAVQLRKTYIIGVTMRGLAPNGRQLLRDQRRETQLTDRWDITYTASTSADGTITRIGRPFTSFGHGEDGTKPLHDAAAERVMKTWMKAYGTAETLRLRSMRVDSTGAAFATYDVVRNGLTFISHNFVGAAFAFSAKDHTFYSMTAQFKVPDIDSTPPKLDKRAAIAALDRIYAAHAVRAQQEQHWKIYYTRLKEPQLGYVVPEGQTRAVPAWLMHYEAYRDTGAAIQGGDSGMLINAVTGEQIPTHVVP